MIYRFCILVCFFLLNFLFVAAGCYDPSLRDTSQKSGVRLAKTTVADTSENQYDIKYVKLNLSLTDTSIYLSGDVTTNAQVVTSSMQAYVFELDSVIIIDSLKLNGQTLGVSTSNGFVRKATLTSPLSQGDLFSVQVFYHGLPPTGTGFFTGIIHAKSTTGVNMVYTVSDPYAAKDWWPSKQSLNDKIDSADIWITVPTGLRAGSNGLLQAVSNPAPGYVQYQWKTRYAIDYYLLCVSVARYFDHSYYMHFTGSPDSMLIQNYLYDSATFMPAHGAAFDSVGLMVDYLSTQYGRYPYYKEKYGHCFTTLSGGMEHQTMTTIGVTTTPLIAHELGHQWFGDHVTYKTWGDVWLSEGFATFTEQLYVEHFWGKVAGANYRKTQYSTAVSSLGGSVFVRDTTNTSSLFNNTLVYCKAAGVVSMLRYLAPNDSLFFVVLQQYQQQFAFGLAQTADLKNIAETVFGQNLDTFFNQWIYEEGYPIYYPKWNQRGDQKYIQLTQTNSKPASVPVFFMPVEIRLKAANGADTIVKVYNNQPVQLYTITWSQTIDSVFIDPDNWIVKRVGPIKYDSTLTVENLKWGNVVVVPNPARSSWHIAQLPGATSLSLMDINGKVLWTGRSNNGGATVPAEHLAPGTYMLRLSDDHSDSTVMRLVRW